MNCDGCPNATNAKCCHQSIAPVPALIMTDAVLANLKTQWNRHYQQKGVWDVLEEYKLV